MGGHDRQLRIVDDEVGSGRVRWAVLVWTTKPRLAVHLSGRVQDLYLSGTEMYMLISLALARCRIQALLVLYNEAACTAAPCQVQAMMIELYI